MQVAPQGDLQAALKLDRIPLETVLSLVPEAKGQFIGALSGNVQADALMAKLGDPASWRGKADLNAPSLEVYGLPINKMSANLVVDGTQAKLSEFKADVEGTPLTGEGAVQKLKGDYAFKAVVHLGRTELTALNRLSPSFRPPIEIKGRRSSTAASPARSNRFASIRPGKCNARSAGRGVQSR